MDPNFSSLALTLLLYLTAATTEKSETETDAEKKKRNQRREDIHVYITMATIIFIAAVVTIVKVILQNAIFQAGQENMVDSDKNITNEI